MTSEGGGSFFPHHRLCLFLPGLFVSSPSARRCWWMARPHPAETIKRHLSTPSDWAPDVQRPYCVAGRRPVIRPLWILDEGMSYSRR